MGTVKNESYTPSGMKFTFIQIFYGKHGFRKGAIPLQMLLRKMQYTALETNGEI